MLIQPLRSATVFSLTADPPRAMLHELDALADFDPGTLVIDGCSHACTVRKVSAAGATLRIDVPLAHDRAGVLALGNGQRVPGRVDWVGASELGFLFDQPIDVIGAIAHLLAGQAAERRRLPRVELQQNVSIRHGSKVWLAQTRNISQGGIGVETSARLEIGEAVQLIFDAMRPITATVAWTQNGQAGIAFDEELGWQTLMPWLRHAQQHPVAPAPTPASVAAAGEGLLAGKHAIRLDAPARIRAGVRWWNARVCAITPQMVELETRAPVATGTALWVSLPEIGGGPATVVETAQQHLLCEFRLPLRPGDLNAIAGVRATA